MEAMQAETLDTAGELRTRTVKRKGPSGHKLIGAAVKQHSAVKRQGMLERLFALWFNGLVYNQIWEDPRVDLEALEVDQASRILTIASGGCNILNYLVREPREICAVDLNPNHMYLTRLKLAALANLPTYEDFFRFFGAGKGIKNIQNYHAYVRDHLDSDTRTYWEGRGLRRLIGRERIKYFKRNFYKYSRSAYFMRALQQLSRLLKCDLTKVLEARSQKEQEDAFDKYVGPSFDHWFVRKVAPLPFVVFSLGIPPQQYKTMREGDGAALVRLYKERIKRLTCSFPIESNYFAWQAFAQKYNTEHPEGVPDYLMRKNYEKIKSAVGRVNTSICSLTEFLRTRDDETLDCFVFLDSQDWMNRATLNELWSEVARVAAPGARIIFRTAAPESPLEENLEPRISELFTYERARSRELYNQDRSAVYGGFHLYRKQK